MGRRSTSDSRRRAATINDVARRAGVSTATVSRALTAPDHVAEKTRARVMAAIEETGYTPNVTARNLRAQSTKIVLALLPGMSNTFFTPILNSIEDTLSASGYGLIIGDTRNSPAKEAHYARLIRAGQVDGVILFTGHPLRGDDAEVGPDLVPISLVCNEIPGEDAYSVFDVANRQAARSAVEFLLSAGHRRIAHIGGPQRNVEARERLAGYREGLATGGIAFDPDLVWGENFRFDAGEVAARRYLDLDDRPTAVFAAADEAAIGFIKTLRDVGIRTPEHVSVIGFDDIDSANFLDPPLTTMQQPRADLGRAAAEDLLTRMERNAPPVPPARIRLPCRLIVRESVMSVPVAEGDARRAARRQRDPHSPGTRP